MEHVQMVEWHHCPLVAFWEVHGEWWYASMNLHVLRLSEKRHEYERWKFIGI
jgi:hypothetical protein